MAAQATVFMMDILAEIEDSMNMATSTTQRWPLSQVTLSSNCNDSSSAPHTTNRRTFLPPLLKAALRFLSVLALLVALLPLPGIASLPSTIVTKRGEFAVRYVPFGGTYTPAEIAFYSNFKTVVTGEFLPPDEVAQLHAAGCKVVFYEWTIAFLDPNTFLSKDGNQYSGLAFTASDWYKSVLARYPLQPGQQDWLLNPLNSNGIPQGFQNFGYYPTFYYDFTSSQLRQDRVSHLTSLVNSHNYDGIFFDTTHWVSLEPAAQAVFEARHPQQTGESSYQYKDRMSETFDAAAGQFFSLLKTTAPNLVVFTNQGYRDIRYIPNVGTPLYSYYLPYATMDSSESYMTTLGSSYGGAVPPVQIYVAGQGLQQVTESYVHPWINPANLWDSTAFYEKLLITDPLAAGGFTTPIDNINYASPYYQPTGGMANVNGVAYPVYNQALDREAIYYGVAASALLGQSSFTRLLDSFNTPPADDVYYVDLGKAHADGQFYAYDPQATNQGRQLAWRLFDNGIAVVNDTGTDTTHTFDASIIPPDVTGLWDVFAGHAVPNFLTNRTLSIPASRYTATQRTVTSGRIYAFMRSPNPSPPPGMTNILGMAGDFETSSPTAPSTGTGWTLWLPSGITGSLDLSTASLHSQSQRLDFNSQVTAGGGPYIEIPVSSQSAIHPGNTFNFSMDVKTGSFGNVPIHNLAFWAYIAYEDVNHNRIGSGDFFPVVATDALSVAGAWHTYKGASPFAVPGAIGGTSVAYTFVQLLGDSEAQGATTGSVWFDNVILGVVGAPPPPPANALGSIGDFEVPASSQPSTGAGWNLYLPSGVSGAVDNTVASTGTHSQRLVFNSAMTVGTGPYTELSVGPQGAVQAGNTVSFSMDAKTGPAGSAPIQNLGFWAYIAYEDANHNRIGTGDFLPVGSTDAASVSGAWHTYETASPFTIPASLNGAPVAYVFVQLLAGSETQGATVGTVWFDNVVLGSSVPSPAPVSINALAPAGDFETPSSVYPWTGAGWMGSLSPGVTGSIDASNATTGSHSQRLDVNSPATFQCGPTVELPVSASSTITPGSSLSYSMDVDTAPLPGHSGIQNLVFWAYIAFEDSSHAVIPGGEGLPIPPTDASVVSPGWMTYSAAPFQVPASINGRAVAYVRLVLFVGSKTIGGAAGTVWFDNIVLSPSAGGAVSRAVRGVSSTLPPVLTRNRVRISHPKRPIIIKRPITGKPSVPAQPARPIKPTGPGGSRGKG